MVICKRIVQINWLTFENPYDDYILHHILKISHSYDRQICHS